jgi:hypothetical protein
MDHGIQCNDARAGRCLRSDAGCVEGGVWQGGRAPTIDKAGNAYFATGNGKWDGTRNFGDSLLKFSVSTAGLTPIAYFTPANEATLDADDDDLSGSGFTLLPDTSPALLLGGGKEGVLSLLNADNLGGKVSNDTQIPQKFHVNGGHVMGGPVYWKSSTLGSLIYNWAEDDVLKAYRFVNQRVVTTPYAQGHAVSPGHPGGSLALSANGSAENSGIIGHRCRKARTLFTAFTQASCVRTMRKR